MQKIKVLILVFLTCHFYVSFSQITISPTVGCAPLNNVSFNGPAGASNILWNFGDLVTSNLPSPTHNYSSSGNFIVTYTAIVAGNPVSYTASVISYSPPTASFTFTLPSVRCKPLNVPFTSTSTGPNSSMSYTWNFGDGGQGSTSNPIWTYNLNGSFFVTLLVKDNVTGCTSSLSQQQGPINVSNPPTVVISSNPSMLTACSAPFSPAFSGSNCISGSPTGGGLTYSWNFGNTQTSSQQNPSGITYNAQGNYTVSLTATDNNNCSASTTKTVSVSQPTLIATVPTTACAGPGLGVSFQTNQAFTYWSFGSQPLVAFATGTAPTTSSVGPGFPGAGVYTINIVAGSAPCTVTQTKTITVQQAITNFTYTPPSFTCSPTFTAQYLNQSSPSVVSFSWTATQYQLTGLYTSNAANPTFTFTQGSLNPYVIYPAYTPTVILYGSTSFGCVDTTLHIFDTIRRPTAWFNTNKSEGCAPLVVDFRDSSFTSLPLFPITSYTWNNGASPATTFSGTLVSPATIPIHTFTYTAPGTYTPFLTIQTASGCTDVSYIHTITVVNPPVTNFVITPTMVCASQAVTVNATATSTSPVQHWHVNSDNGFFSHCINDPNPSWNFTHVGVHTFTLEAYSHSCKGSTTTPQSVIVKGPIVSGRYETNCTPGTRRVVKFYSFLQDVATATLDFGDGSPIANIVGTPGANASSILTHTYSTYTPNINQNFTVTLTGVNGATGCAANTYTMLVTVRDIQSNFTLPAVVCVGTSTLFNGSSSQDVHTGCQRGYIWYFDNGPPKDTISATVTHAFATAGTHSVLLMVKDDNSCVDITMHTIRVSDANPTFTFSANPICLSNGTVQMINTTAQPPTVPDPVNDFIWNFGDGSNPLQTTTPTSPIHTYTSATSPSQIYTITLTATNTPYGCINTVSHTLQVNNPSAALAPSSVLICIPTIPSNPLANVTFTAPAGYTSYTLDYGDGSSPLTTTNNITVHNYTATGTYTVFLGVNLGGCTNSSSSVVVKAQSYPIANFSYTPSSICKDQQVQFTNTSTVVAAFTPSLIWNLGTNAPIIPANNVVWTYNTNTTVVVSLTVFTNPNLCQSVISKTINVFGVKATPLLDKQEVCYGEAIKFNVKNDSSTVESWDWDFGDGSTASYSANASPTPTLSHTYNYYPLPNGNTFIQFTGWSSQHQCRQTSTVSIKIIKIDGAFNRNTELTIKDYNHCIGVIDQFSNQTPNSQGYVFNWSFGDGGTANTQNPSYTYPNSGVYTVTLNITDPAHGCKGIAIKNMTINPLPTAVALSKDSVCKDELFALTSNTISGVPAFTYTWNPQAGVLSPNSASTTATSSNSTTYTLTIQDGNGCKNNTTKSVYTQLPPASFQWDTAIVIGQLASLNNYSGSNFSYTWSPPTDLSCIHCPNPTSSSTVNITYTVTIADNLGCFVVRNTHTVEIIDKSSVDVPTAFTPNGDGTNDVIYVDGWGIRKLNYFRVFNRWGQLLFESTDIKVGWDGMFNGIPQNMETYVYQVSAESYTNKESLLKTGTFKLIR